MAFWNSETENIKLAHDLNRAIDDLADRRTLRVYLAVLCIANSMLWIAVIAFPSLIQYGFDRLSQANNKLSVAALGIPFGLGFFITYSLLRLKFPDIEEQHLESLPMGSFDYQTRSTKRWRVWLASAVGGIANLLLVVVTDIYLVFGTGYL